jgi:hypothetical protein
MTGLLLAYYDCQKVERNSHVEVKVSAMQTIGSSNPRKYEGIGKEENPEISEDL